MRSPKDPAFQYTGLISRLFELPSAARQLAFRLGGDREIRLFVDPKGKATHSPSWLPGPSCTLTLYLYGTFTSEETVVARALMKAATQPNPKALAALRDPADPLRGVVFTEQSPYHASALVYDLATVAFRVDAAEIILHRDYEDHDARRTIASQVEEHRRVNILHEESGVRFDLALDGDSGFTLQVPLALLSPNQRYRANRLLEDKRWSLDDNDLGSGDESGYTMWTGDAHEAADAALHLLRTVGELPIDVRVQITPHDS